MAQKNSKLVSQRKNRATSVVDPHSSSSRSLPAVPVLQKMVFLPEQKVPEQQKSGAVKSSRSAPVIQRLLTKIEMTKKGLDCDWDGDRPTGNLKSSDGDHTTPFIVLQSQVINAIIGTDLETAWKNLALTFDLYKKLPGFSLSKTYIQNGQADLGRMRYDINVIMKTGGDLNNLLHAANVLIAFRNQMELSARKTMGGGGKNEGNLAGGLYFMERKFFLIGREEEGEDEEKTEERDKYKEYCFEQRENIILNMIMAFDHGRVDDLSNKKDIWKQHAMTITDAYPQLCEAAKISSDDIVKLQATGRKLWYEKFK